METGNSYSSNFDQINLRRTVMSEYVAGPKDIWWLVNHLSSEFSGQYVLFDIDANPQSHPVAKMAAYLYNAVMVDKSLQAEAIANGLTLALDVSSYDNQWIYNN